jgi:hypothetical protein
MKFKYQYPSIDVNSKFKIEPGLKACTYVETYSSMSLNLTIKKIMSYNVNEKAIMANLRRLHPEMLYPNVEELRQNYLITAEPEFQAEFDAL